MAAQVQTIQCRVASARTANSVSSRATRSAHVSVAPQVQSIGSSCVFRAPSVRALVAQTKQVSCKSKFSVSATVAESASASKSTGGKKKYYYLIANADWMLNNAQNEAMAEQLREKRRFYGEQNLELDFFMVPEPKFLNSHPEIAKRVKRPAIALITEDPVWCTFMKLRLDRVLKGEIEGTPEEILGSLGNIPPMKAPEKWTAPYSRYDPNWYKAFQPKV